MIIPILMKENDYCLCYSVILISVDLFCFFFLGGGAGACFGIFTFSARGSS